MHVVLKIQPITSSEGTIYYASGDGEVILSLQGEITKRSRFETIEVNIPFIDDPDRN